jgi:predicted nucleotidyltransferase
MGEGPNRAKAASKDAALVCYNSVMNFAAAIARLKEHETELKQLSVQHLYLFGSTAGGEAREDSDVNWYFDYENARLQ